MRPWLEIDPAIAALGGLPDVIDPRILREACGLVRGRVQRVLDDHSATEEDYRNMLFQIAHVMRCLGAPIHTGPMTPGETRQPIDLPF